VNETEAFENIFKERIEIYEGALKELLQLQELVTEACDWIRKAPLQPQEKAAELAKACAILEKVLQQLEAVTKAREKAIKDFLELQDEAAGAGVDILEAWLQRQEEANEAQRGDVLVHTGGPTTFVSTLLNFPF
jgi:predicted unusual protein kinase regulating ubiquinone biosynthesis (AarF/ABC1/UbiB family)